jgi:hypothetical protein
VGWKCLGPHPGSLYWKFCGELSFDIGNISLREIFQSLERAINLMGVPAEQQTFFIIYLGRSPIIITKLSIVLVKTLNLDK